jgi:hypothetical protein
MPVAKCQGGISSVTVTTVLASHAASDFYEGGASVIIEAIKRESWLDLRVSLNEAIDAYFVAA